MSTVALQASKDAVEHKLSGDNASEWGRLLGETLRDFRIGEYPTSYQDMIFQKWERFKPTIEDAYNFLNIHAYIRLGYVSIFSINVGRTPPSDKSHDLQNEALSSLPFPYRAEFWGGTQDEDGILEWSKPRHGIVSVQDEVLVCLIPPLSVPLEVGTCSSEKMFLYICGRSAMGVARWPYYSEKIYVITPHFISSNDDRFTDSLSECGETIEEFVYNKNSNPNIDWGAHKSKRIRKVG
jgi:hypothetical protein